MNKSSGNFDSAVVLANAYFDDLGTWYGITPFIGGGVGYAFNHVSSYSTNQQFTSPTYAYDYTNAGCGCIPYAPVYDPNGNAVYNTNSGSKFYKDKTTGSFAWGAPCRSRLQRDRRAEDRTGLPLPEPRQGRDGTGLRAVLAATAACRRSR